jgi:hypothetical protein
VRRLREEQEEQWWETLREERGKRLLERGRERGENGGERGEAGGEVGR